MLYKHVLDMIIADVIALFRFLVEFNLYSWWYSDLTAKGTNDLSGMCLISGCLSKHHSHMHMLSTAVSVRTMLHKLQWL